MRRELGLARGFCAGVLAFLAAAAHAEGPADPVASERLVYEEEWAADLVDLLALDEALPERPTSEDLFSLLCADRIERVVDSGGREAPAGPRFEAASDVRPPARPGEPARVVLSVPATALYTLGVEGTGLQRWVIDQRPVGHLDPTPLGVVWSPAAMALREGPHELTGYFTPGAGAARVSLTAMRALCIAPADGWHAQRRLSQGAKARTLVRAFGYERRLPMIGTPLLIEGESYESASEHGGRTNRRVKVAASGGVWATASQDRADLRYRMAFDEPAMVTLEARVLGDSQQLWGIDGRYHASVMPGAGRDVFAWSHVLTVPLLSGEHTLDVRIPRQSGVDVIRATARRSRDADYVTVLRGLGLPVSAAQAPVTRADALASLSAPAFVELANRFEQRIEGDRTDRQVVLVDENPRPKAAARPLSAVLPADL